MSEPGNSRPSLTINPDNKAGTRCVERQPDKKAQALVLKRQSHRILNKRRCENEYANQIYLLLCRQAYAEKDSTRWRWRRGEDGEDKGRGAAAGGRKVNGKDGIEGIETWGH